MRYGIIASFFITSANACELSQVKSIIDNYYVKEIGQEQFEKAAAKGVIASLDPHSTYIEKEDFQKINEVMEGAYVGVGIEMTISKGYPLILSVAEEGPGARSGIKSSDIIFAIDGKNLYGLPITDVRNLIKGKVGTNVTFTIVRDDKKTEFKLVRETIKVISSYVKLIDDIAYLRIKHFTKDLAKNIKTAYDKLDKDKINGVIIDMRYNPGGLLDEGVNVASLFLENQSKVVSIRGRNSQSTRDFLSNGSDIAKGLPIVVIINSTSASASEIVAGALQDNKRGQVVGTRSFGKGSVQGTFALKNSDVIKLTTALYYTPSGRVIQGNGVIPDVVVQDEMVLEKVPLVDLFSENNLPNTLPDHLFDKVKDLEKAQLYRKKIVGDLEKDFQLMRAVDIIRTMNFYRGK